MAAPKEAPAWIESRPSTEIRDDVAFVKSGSGGARFHMAMHPHILLAWAVEAIAMVRAWQAGRHVAGDVAGADSTEADGAAGGETGPAPHD